MKSSSIILFDISKDYLTGRDRFLSRGILSILILSIKYSVRKYVHPAIKTRLLFYIMPSLWYYKPDLQPKNEVYIVKNKMLAVFSYLLVIIFCSTVLITGCSGSGGIQVTDLTSLTKMTPEDSNTVIFMDASNLRMDKDLGDLYTKMMEGFEDAVMSSETGMNIDNINSFAITELDFEQVVWISGDFDFEAIREYNEKNDYEKDEYKGVEIWYGTDNALAIHNNTLITGNEDSVKECIDVIDDPKKSIYELNEDIRDVIEILPDGLFSMVSGYAFHPDANTMGMTYAKLNADTFKASGVMKFDNEDDADSAFRELKEDMDSDEISNFQISRTKELVEFSAEVGIDEAGLFW